MAYVPIATQVSQPTEDKFVESAALEFRTLKTAHVALSTSIADFQAQLDLIEAAIGSGTDSASLAAALASATSALVGTGLIGYKQNSIGSVTRTLYSKLQYEDLNVFDFFSTSQIADVIGYTYLVDVTAAITAAVEALKVRGGGRLWFPAGGYSGSINFSMLAQNTTLPFEDRGKPITLVGAGCGEPFVFTTPFMRGTIIKSPTLDVEALKILNDPINPNGDSGTLIISGFRFVAQCDTTGKYVGQINSFCAQSQIENCVFYNSTITNGGGLVIHQMSTGSVLRCHFMNSNWITSGGGGGGKGLEITQNVNNNGLPNIERCTSRGFQYGYVLGDGVHRSYSMRYVHCETSNCQYGIWIKPFVSGALIDHLYEEGVANTCVLNQGDDSVIVHGEFLFGFQVGIDDTYTGNGCTIMNNYLEATDAINCNMINVFSSGAQGGPLKVVKYNRMLYNGAGVSTVHGITLTGIDPQVDLSSNAFNPRGDWAGPGKKINDLSTSSGIAAGSGNYGFSMADDVDRNFPFVARGAYGLGVAQTVLTQANVSANTLTLGKPSHFVMTPTVAVVVNNMTGTNISDKWFSIRVTNGNTTFADTGAQMMSGGIDFTPTGACTIWFHHVNGITWEQSRTLYY